MTALLNDNLGPGYYMMSAVNTLRNIRTLRHEWADATKHGNHADMDKAEAAYLAYKAKHPAEVKAFALMTPQQRRDL